MLDYVIPSDAENDRRIWSELGKLKSNIAYRSTVPSEALYIPTGKQTLKVRRRVRGRLCVGCVVEDRVAEKYEALPCHRSFRHLGHR